MTFLQLPTEIHTSLLLEWIPFYKEYSALDVALSERRYWLELLRSPVLVVDPPLAIAPDRSYYTWLESRQLKVATLRVNMAEMPSIKTMRFPSITKVKAVFEMQIKDTAALADFLKANSNVSHLITLAHNTLRLYETQLLDLAKHPLALRVLDLRGTIIQTRSGYSRTVCSIMALLYQVGSTLEELRLHFDGDALRSYSADIVETIAHVCRRLLKLELVAVLLPYKSIQLLCAQNGNFTELRCYAAFDTATEADSAVQELLNKLPRLAHLSFKGNINTKLPNLVGRQVLRSVETNDGSVNLIQRTVAIRDFVTPARAHEILMTLPCAMRSISAECDNFSRSELLQIVQKHGAELEKIPFGFTAMSADEWRLLWAMCPKLVVVRNSHMTLDLTARCFSQGDCSAEEATAALLGVSMRLLAIHLKTSTHVMQPTDILAIAAKHGATLQEFGMRLHVGELGIVGLEQFLQLCPELNYLDLSHAGAASLELVAKYCTRTMIKLTMRDSQQLVADVAIISVLQEQPQLTELTLIDCAAVTAAILDHIGSLTTLTIAGDSGISKFDIIDGITAGKLSNLTKLCLGLEEKQLFYIRTILQVILKDKDKAQPMVVAASF